MPLNQDEQEFIRQAQNGDTAAFAVLMEMHAQFVFNLALRTLNDAQEAEDIAQETFLRAWQGLRGFRAEAHLRTWLYRIAINLCYNRLPGLTADLAALDAANAILPLETTRAAEAILLSAEMRRQLYAAVDELPETYRLLITLRHVDGYRYEEIADIAQMSLGKVKTILFRARRQLRQSLIAYEELADG